MLAVVLLVCGLLGASLVACTDREYGASPGVASADSVDETPAAMITVEPVNQATDYPPGSPVTVAVQDGTLETVILTRSDGVRVPGTTAPERTSWQSSQPLDYDSGYTVLATAKGADNRKVTSKSSFSTVTPRTLTYPSMNPLDGQTVGVGQPLAVYFDEPITNRRAAEEAITVTTNPEVQGAFYWFSNKEVHWRPRNFWEPGTAVTVEVSIFGKDLGDGVYGQENRVINFTIGDAFVARADGASHRMTVEINGTVVRTMPISMGRPEFASHNGIHVVTERHAHKIMDSRTFGLVGVGAYRTAVDWAVRISSGGQFVHSAPWSVGDQGYRNVSHGCINLAPADAKWFYDTVKKGDIVINTNTRGPTLQPWDGFGDWQIPWEEWVAGGAA